MSDGHKRQDGQWILIGLLWALGLAAGIFGFGRYAAWHGQTASVWDEIYLSLQLISMNSGAVADPIPWELEIARFVLPFLAGATALKAFWGIIRERVRSAQLIQISNHTIICGLSRKGFLLAMSFRKEGRQVVVIERDEENDWLETCREKGMIVLLGDAAEPVMLTRAGIKRADAILAVCDDDGINAAIAVQAESLVADRSDGKLKCLAHIDDPRLCGLLNEQMKTPGKKPFELILFSAYESGAIRMVQEYPAWETPADHPPHIVVVGLGHLGQNLVVHLARTWRNVRPDKSWNLRITVIDQDARSILKTLVARHPELADGTFFNPVTLNIHSAEFEGGEYLNGKIPDRIYVCLDSESHVLEAGLTLQHTTSGKVPIILRMAESYGLAQLVNQPSDNLFAFILLERICTPDLLKIHAQI